MNNTIKIVCACSLILVGVCFFSFGKAKDTAMPNIIFNSLPKTGSRYVVAMLKQGLNYEVDLIRSDVNAKYWGIIKNKHGLISKQHMWPSQEYVDDCKKSKQRIVVHVRDPRQALLSLVHHQSKPNIDNKHFMLPDEFFSMTWEQKIDWNIENRLPGMVAFIKGWLEIKQQQDLDPNGLKMLLTTYDELLNDEMQLINKILSFYNIDPAKFKFQPIAKNTKVGFRKGDVNEWRHELSEKQKQRVAEIVPEDLLQRFGWE